MQKKIQKDASFFGDQENVNVKNEIAYFISPVSKFKSLIILSFVKSVGKWIQYTSSAWLYELAKPFGGQFGSNTYSNLKFSFPLT